MNKKIFVMIVLLILIPSISAIVENNVVGDLVDQSGNQVTNAKVNVYSTAHDSTCSLLAGLDSDAYTACGCPVTCELGDDVYTYLGHFSESPRYRMYYTESYSCEFINVLEGQLCDAEINPTTSNLWVSVDGSTATPPIPLQFTTDQNQLWNSYWNSAVNAYDFGEILLSDSDGDGYNQNIDCDDTNANINPAATEVCDTVDNNCDGAIDENVKTTYYLDSDSDNYGDSSQFTLACSAPDGYVLDNTDCVDDNDAVNPNAADICNGIDDNCVAGVDEGNVCPTNAYYCDIDSDSYLSSSISGSCDTFDCIPDGCSSSQGNDCDDGAANVKPGATETCNLIDDNCNGQIDEGVENTYYQDSDGDTYGNVGVIAEECSLPDGYVLDNTDCDDTQSAVRPGATETCNLIDDNCDGAIDENVKNTYYLDSDGDTYGDASQTSLACSVPEGYVSDNTDCVDDNNLVNPSRDEICNGLDDNCINGIDEFATCPITAYYCDDDSDSYLSSGVSGTCITFDCIPVGCSSSQGNDCNDSLSNVKPGALETCNLIDDNCDGQVDEGVETTYYQDLDGDTYGNLGVIAEECSVPTGFVADYTDCDDTKSSVKPGTTETCNLIDDNCDGVIDEGVKNTYYLDSDSDTYGDSGETTLACSLPDGYIDNSVDCDDSNPNKNPAQNEVCNNVDDNCALGIDEGDVCPSTAYYCDTDFDGYLSSSISGTCDTFECIPDGCSSSQGDDCDDGTANVKPGATEVCNAIDDNCNDQVDEGVKNTYYQDADQDSFGNVEVIIEACSAPYPYVTNSNDCDDTISVIHPDATETCNLIDDNCDGQVDEGVENTYYLDSDDDSYGDASVTSLACSPPDGYVSDNTDCVDSNVNINPAQNDVCNDVDDNCVGGVDENDVCPSNSYYCDTDSDSYLSSSISGTCDTFECIPDGCLSSQGDDCDDGVANVRPGNLETCNLIDDNCNDQVDEGVENIYYRDSDGDGFGDLDVIAEECIVPDGYVEDSTDCDDTKSGVNPGLSEVCFNGIDDNCNGVQNEECVPNAPEQFTINKVSDSSIKLEWLPIEGVNDYNVYYSSNAYSLDVMDTSALSGDITRSVIEDVCTSDCDPNKACYQGNCLSRCAIWFGNNLDWNQIDAVQYGTTPYGFVDSCNLESLDPGQSCNFFSEDSSLINCNNCANSVCEGISPIVVSREDVVSFTDDNFAGNPVRYYRVSSVNGIYEELTPEILGKQTFVLYGIPDTGNLRDTENWISLALDVSYTASSFMDMVPDVYRINQLQRGAGTFDRTSCDKGYACGEDDFVLQPGQGYGVEVGSDSEVTVVGGILRGSTSINLYGQESDNILDTENWISVPYSSTQHTAESLMDNMPGVFRVHKLARNSETPYFNLISCDSGSECGADNFIIKPGEGYKVEMSQNVEVTP